MRVGATLAHLSPAAPYPVAEWARRLVGAGFESLWTPQVVGRGYLVPDPFVTVAAAATATATADGGVEVGTATVQVPLHHPADLAYRILSLQAVCGDRLTLGLSPGWSRADFATFDRDHATRFRTFDENVARLRTLLATGRDERADLAPAPVTATPPPFLLGSWGANVEKAARTFDGWLASAERRTAEEMTAALERYRAAGGRRAMVCTIRLRGAADLGPTGELLGRLAEAGFDDAIVLIEPDGPDPEQVRTLLP